MVGRDLCHRQADPSKRFSIQSIPEKGFSAAIAAAELPRPEIGTFVPPVYSDALRYWLVHSQPDELEGTLSRFSEPGGLSAIQQVAVRPLHLRRGRPKCCLSPRDRRAADHPAGQFRRTEVLSISCLRLAFLPSLIVETSGKNRNLYVHDSAPINKFPSTRMHGDFCRDRAGKRSPCVAPKERLV